MQISLTLPERIGAIIVLSEVKVAKRKVLNMILATKKAVEIQKEEVAEYGITARPDGGLDWAKETAEKAKEITLSDEGYEYIKTRLEEMDKKGVHIDVLPIANKILGAVESNG